MSIEHMACVLHHSKAKGTAKLVLLGIANHEGDGGAWPSVATLAVYANVNERAVQKAIGQLVSKGELRRDVQAGGTKDWDDYARPNLYRVLVTCPPWCDRTPTHRDTRRLAGRQSPLWKTPGEGVSHRTPGVPQDTGGGVPQDTQTVHTNHPTHQVVSQPQDARASTPPCETCGARTQLYCERRQVKLAADDRHAYRPSR